MSAEGKKKRGISGVANAKSSPFRMNGWAPDWWARSMGAYNSGPALSGGSAFMRGFVGGMIAEAAGYGTAQVSDSRFAHAEARCTHPMLKDRP